MRLDKDNDIPSINTHLDNLERKTKGRRNLHEAIEKLQSPVLTHTLGDRSDAPNICIFFTPAHYIWRIFKYHNLRKHCYRIIVLRQGVAKDLDTIRDKVCPEAAYLAGRYIYLSEHIYIVYLFMLFIVLSYSCYLFC